MKLNTDAEVEERKEGITERLTLHEQVNKERNKHDKTKEELDKERKKNQRLKQKQKSEVEKLQEEKRKLKKKLESY